MITLPEPKPEVRPHVQEVAAHFELDKHIQPVDLTLHPGVPDGWGFVDTSVSPPAYLAVIEATNTMIFGHELSQAQRLSASLGATAFLEGQNYNDPHYYVAGPMSEHSLLTMTDDPRMQDVEPDYEHFSADNWVDLRALVPVDVAEQGRVVSGLANRVLQKRSSR